ncbi:ATP-binding protein [Amaricoccus macauensis]|uniref:hybrid sensor histidine kinase/response regulator n=1 Tax=Amaricoccus macauensis TaxID=57001 RepID=UPI003C7B807C
MHDTHQYQNTSASTESRSGVFVALSGILLLVATLTTLWSGTIVVPAAIAVALVVFGTYMLCLRLGLTLGARSSRHGLIRYYDSDVVPVFISDLSGQVISRNACAGSSGFIERWASDAPSLIYRLTRETETNGSASELSSDGRHRIGVSRVGPRLLMWRVERAAPPEQLPADFSECRYPWFRIDEDARVLSCNEAAHELEDDPIQSLDALLLDPPFRAGTVQVLAANRQVVRSVVLNDDQASREVLILPLDSSEVSGLAPNDFLEELPVALARLKNDGDFIYANHAARTLLGVANVEGKNITKLMDGLGRSISERLSDTAKGRGLGRSEVAKSKAEGQDNFLQVAFSRTVHEGEQTVLAVLSDATELKTLEAQFVQSQKMQAVGQLAGGVAHDFNNLLTAINGHCDLLLMRHDVADVEHGDLMQIRQNANRAAALVRQLLAFSRKQTLRPTVINLQDTLSELTHLLNRLLSEKVTLRIEHGTDLSPVRVDERQFEQVIMNLVVNARDAMPRGGEVRVSTRNIHLAEDMHRDRAVVFKGDYVVVEVADSGTGIPPDKLHKIFEPFFTTKQVGEGTGLGLSTAYGIIKQTGGFIFAESPPGSGAIFTIYLPAYETAETEALVEPEIRAPRDLTGRGLVLLVEDEDPVRSFAARALQLRGYTVIEAASGEEALDILKDDDLHVDIMLSDVIMPGLDGPAWVREARKKRPAAKVIFMSGYTEDAFSTDETMADASFLPKPFTLPELTQRVKDMLDA